VPSATVPPVGWARAASTANTLRQEVPSSSVRTMAELVLFMALVPLEPDGQIEKYFRRFLAAVAARHRMQRARALDRAGHVVGQPEAHAAADREDVLVGQRQGVVDVPGRRRVGEDTDAAATWY